MDTKWVQPTDTGFNRNPFTVSASVREEYDDNINTTNTNKVSAFKTYLTPSLLFEYPADNTLFSMRATFNATYYSNGRGSEPWEFGGDLLTSLSHNFTDRFSIEFRNQFRAAQNPQVLDGNVTTLQQDGTYFNDNASLQFNAQWTPIFSTVTAWNFQWWDYQSESLSEVNNRIVNTVSQDFRWLTTPTITFVTGGNYTNTNYTDQSNSPVAFINNGQLFFFPPVDRNWSAYAGYVGLDWQLQPTMLVGFRLGAQVFDPVANSSSVSPYATAYYSWQIGARSSVDAAFSHGYQDTSIANQISQIATTLTFGYNYQWTPRFSTRLQFVVSNAAYDNATAVSGLSTGSFDEQTYAVGLNGSYDINTWLSVIGGYSFVDLVSPISTRQYVRNRVWIGVTGTF